MKLGSLWLPDPADLAVAPLERRRDSPGRGGWLLGFFALVALVSGVLVGPRLHLADGAFLRDAVLVQALPLVSVVVLAVAPVIAAVIARRAHGRHVAALALALFGIVVGSGALLILGHPLVHRGHCSFQFGHDNPGIMAAPFLASALCAGGGLAATLGAWVLCPVVSTGRRVRTAAWTSLILGAALLLAAAWSAHRRSSPTLGAYIASLPELGTVTPVRRGPAGFDAVKAPWAGMYDAGDAMMTVAHVADLEVRVRIDGPLRLAGPGFVDGSYEERWPMGLPFNDETPLTIRRDVARRLVLVESEQAHGRDVHTTGVRAAFSEPGFQLVEITARDLSGLSGPPLAWVLGAAGLLLVALLALTARRAPIRALAHPGAWCEGRLDGAGSVVIEGAPRCQAPADLAGSRGPAVVVPLGPARPATYRVADGWGPVMVVPATAAELRAAVDAAEAARALLAIAAVSLGSAPLLAACAYGLVGP